MFSGIVESLGSITHLEFVRDCLHLRIRPELPFNDLYVGASVAINGVCLTVTELFPQEFSAVIVPETLRLTNLGQLAQGSLVNLERSLKADSRNSGHTVQGHVDAMGEIIELKADGQEALLVKIQIPPVLSKYIVNKGYIALDGMSITVIEAATEWFTITLIPHTQKVTIAQQYKLGAKVNLEVDILSKYLEKLMKYNTYANTH